MPRGVYERHRKVLTIQAQEDRVSELQLQIDELQRELTMQAAQLAIRNQKILDLQEELLSCYRKLSPRA